MKLTRRTILAATGGLFLAGPMALASRPNRSAWVVGHIPDSPFDIDLTDLSLVPPDYRRQEVVFRGPEASGTIVVDADKRHLYLVKDGGRAVRFGTAVGRSGAAWHGTATVGRKAKWPTWTPTANMRKRNPKLPVTMAGGPDNPLGARALYLYKDGRDTLYRIHGTNEPWSIGHAASSGCIRMLNEDAFELFGSVPVGTRVIVR